MRALLAPLMCAACAAPPAPVADLAPLFFEQEHDFLMGAPALRLEDDSLQDAHFAAEGPLVIEPGGHFTSGWMRGRRPFDEVLASWNARVPSGAGLTVEVQARGVEASTPWLYLGGWGDTPAKETRVVTFEGGRVAVDVLILEDFHDEVRLRLACRGAAPIEVHRTTVSLTDCLRLEALSPAPATRAVSLDVPARSQQVEAPDLAPRICSPTSVAMVLEAGGVNLPTAEVAALAYDADHDIYGNWPRAVQAAFQAGVPGTLVRLSSWRAVQHFLEAGVPLIISVGAKPGQLQGAPYESTAGHLLVLRGLTPGGDVLVNDPAAATPDEVPRTYRREDLELCWMRRGGVAYAIGQ